MKKVLIPIPSYGFDPTEVAIPYKILKQSGFNLVFATPNGKRGEADSLMLEGKHLGIWKPVLMARHDAVEAYRTLEKDENFRNPVKYSDLKAADFDALLLAGGHDKGVKEYLESEILQKIVVDFFKVNKPVAAICHGVVLLARSIDSHTNKSVIHEYKTTALLKKQEILAYNLTKWWLDDYYLTYPEITVEDEVLTVLVNKNNFIHGKTPLFRDDLQHLARGFFVRDRNYLSARWPSDAYNFALEFVRMLNE